MRFDVARATVSDERPFGRSKRDLESLHNAIGDFVLNLEDAREFAIVALRPKVRAIRGVDQLAVMRMRLPSRRSILQEPTATRVRARWYERLHACACRQVSCA